MRHNFTNAALASAVLRMEKISAAAKREKTERRAKAMTVLVRHCMGEGQ